MAQPNTKSSLFSQANLILLLSIHIATAPLLVRSKVSTYMRYSAYSGNARGIAITASLTGNEDGDDGDENARQIYLLVVHRACE